MKRKTFDACYPDGEKSMHPQHCEEELGFLILAWI